MCECVCLCCHWLGDFHLIYLHTQTYDVTNYDLYRIAKYLNIPWLPSLFIYIIDAIRLFTIDFFSFFFRGSKQVLKYFTLYLRTFV